MQTEKLSFEFSLNKMCGSYMRISFLKLSGIIYVGWLLVSVYLSFFRIHKLIYYFPDLPSYLNRMPPSILSFIYLILFVPAIFSVTLFALYIVITILVGHPQNDLYN
jgi:hypothetical protein